MVVSGLRDAGPPGVDPMILPTQAPLDGFGRRKRVGWDLETVANGSGET